MEKVSSKEACQLAANLIDEQLAVLSIALPMLTDDQSPNQNLSQKMICRRVLISNALLAVWVFLKEHDISDSRTPQVQFLRHLGSAIVNMNTFRIEPGYVPGASFNGLSIDSTLNGARLFADDVTTGFMTFDDAIALLQWLSRHLRGVQNYVSGGDAG
jgi:hypothetical protein